MPGRRVAHHRIFLSEFRQNFAMTGSLLPSSRFLAKALVRYVADNRHSSASDAATDRPRRILEAGPGTGPVTRRLITAMAPGDTLDLVEWNPRFVSVLERRLSHDRVFREVADRVSIQHARVEELPGTAQYDLIVSGLPLNNFSVELVGQVLETFQRLLRPGGTLSFFEYMGVRSLRARWGAAADRARLQGISQRLEGAFESLEIRRDWVWANVPPAWVHHLRMPGLSVNQEVVPTDTSVQA